MEIFNADQVRKWDEYTTTHEPISSLDLMERASLRCTEWIINRYPSGEHVKVFCGKGNNGGDGLAIARLLINSGYQVTVYILEFGSAGTEDFQANLQRLHALTDKIFFIQLTEHLPLISTGEIVIDAILGSGLNKPVEGLYAELIRHINHSGARVISIDIPSGMFIDKSSKGHEVIQADHTLTFQCWKPAFLAAENGEQLGILQILPIGLHPGFLQTSETNSYLLTLSMIRNFFRKRKRFSHKGNFGHVLLAGGSQGKMGAMVLAVKASLHSGSGLTTAFIPLSGNDILQTTVPEAMVIKGEENDHLSGLPGDIESYASIGAGPGMGVHPDSLKSLSFLIRRYSRPMVIDADAINCISLEKSLLEQLPPNSILTPHPKEFDRVFGEHDNDFDRWQKAGEVARQFNIIIVLKGHHTLICLPDGLNYYNSTGNSGLAKGGSGDVLTGLITSLLAQGYTPPQAAMMGVYLHGLAGDLASAALSEETMTAIDLIKYFTKAFQTVRT
jgi:ADP-dependent NAD(P)H-hydrate dehydratase / NAD(P)H-hydrate epimerase